MEKYEQTEAQHESVQKLALTEEDALAHRRNSPDDDESIYIIYGPDDKDNPRNWSIGRKYYVASFASALNALTYVPQSLPG